MKKTIIALAAACAFASSGAWAADCLDDGRYLTVKGTIVQSAFTPTQGTEFRRSFMAIALDQPRCASGFIGDTITGMIIVQVKPVDLKWVGHHVAIDATVEEGASGTWPTFVHLNVSNIREAN